MYEKSPCLILVVDWNSYTSGIFGYGVENKMLPDLSTDSKPEESTNSELDAQAAESTMQDSKQKPDFAPQGMQGDSHKRKRSRSAMLDGARPPI